MKVSIVVPVYNVEKYLEECLESLLRQTYSNLEILLIDDGSTDTSGQICDRFAAKDSRIRTFHKENGGVSSARNLGISVAEGDYLVFVDSDDFIHEQMIATYMTHVDDAENIFCDITSDQITFEKAADTSEEIPQEYVEKQDFIQLYSNNYMNPPFNKCYRMSIIKKYRIHFPEDMNLGEDLLFNLEYFRHTQSGYCILHCPLYFYRENRAESLSTSYRTGLFAIQQQLFEAVKRFLLDTDIWTPENQAGYYGLYWDRLYLTLQLGKEYEKKNPKEHHLAQILKEPVWDQVWMECRKRKLLTWKRRIKYICLQRMRKGYL